MQNEQSDRILQQATSLPILLSQISSHLSSSSTPRPCNPNAYTPIPPFHARMTMAFTAPSRLPPVRRPAPPQQCGRQAPFMKSSKRRPRPSPSPPPSSDPSSKPDSAPHRINLDNSTLSLREQLQQARSQTDSTTPTRRVERTRFRRKKSDGADSGRRGRVMRELSNTEIPEGKFNIVAEPLLFVDGYNVVGAWPRLRKWRDRDDLENARRLLLDDVAEFAAVRRWDCVVVFDAYATGSFPYSYFSFYFVISMSASTFLEQSVYVQTYYDCEKKHAIY